MYNVKYVYVYIDIYMCFLVKNAKSERNAFSLDGYGIVIDQV